MGSLAHVTGDTAKAEIDGGQLLNETSVFSHIEPSLSRYPHALAVVCPSQPRDHLSDLVSPDAKQEHTNGHKTLFPECLTLTYLQLHGAAMNLAAGLIRHGVRPGSTMLMLVPNGGEYCILLWACVVMRLTFVCVDPGLVSDVSQESELRFIIEMTRPSVIVLPGAGDAEALRATADHLLLPETLIISTSEGDGDPDGALSLAGVAADGSKYRMDEDTLLIKARDDDPERIHSIMFTSGTSGRPKGCPLRVGGMSHVLHSQSWLLGEGSSSFALQQAHNSRAIAPFQTLQTWKAGGAVVMTGRGLRVDDMVDAITRYQVTFVVLTPPMVLQLSQELAARPLGATNSVRRIQIGGDAVTKDVLVKCAGLFPESSICVNHGMTEGAGAFKWPFFDTPAAKIQYFGQICPVGTVAPGAVVRIWDAEGKTVAGRGQPGELHIQCGSLITEYLGGSSAASFYNDEKGRWFITGDIAMLDNSGLVFILGRGKDMILRSGTAIMPAVIESCIKEITGTEASVVAVPNAEHFQAPFAVIDRFNGKTEDEIMSHIVHVLGKEYELSGLASLETIGMREFPLNATHKVVKTDVQRAVLRWMK
ncbi:putative amp dependent CoA ligase [Diaporthe sp. PMI_573]|nr:putative amp dependent CoA ligase [Diaporthaceae sp. PMI_573]